MVYDNDFTCDPRKCYTIEDHFQADRERLVCGETDPYQQDGIPDILAIKNGKTVFIEVKRPGEVARPLQLARHRELRSKGIDVYVMHDTNFQFKIDEK